MTKREFWLKLFTENNVALASAIHLCERYIDDKSLTNGTDFIQGKIKELDNPMPEEQIIDVFHR